MLDLDQREIPEEGIPLEGEIADDIFQLTEDSIVPVGPVRYQARAYVIDGELVIEGTFGADFSVECSRCLERFVYGVELKHHNLTENLENTREADLTEALRGDILLALPTHPRCEEGKIPRKCPAAGKFDLPSGAPDPDGAAAEAPNPWAELDNLEGLDSKTSD